MFRSQEMKKVELVIPRQDVVSVTEALAASGIFHLAQQEHTGIVPADYRDGENWHEQASLFAALEQRIPPGLGRWHLGLRREMAYLGPS